MLAAHYPTKKVLKASLLETLQLSATASNSLRLAIR